MPRRALSLSEVAEQFGVSVDTLRREIADGRLHAWRLRRQIRVDAAEVERYRRAAAEVAAVATERPTHNANAPTSRTQRVTRLFDVAAALRAAEETNATAAPAAGTPPNGGQEEARSV